MPFDLSGPLIYLFYFHTRMKSEQHWHVADGIIQTLCPKKITLTFVTTAENSYRDQMFISAVQLSIPSRGSVRTEPASSNHLKNWFPFFQP